MAAGTKGANDSAMAAAMRKPGSYHHPDRVRKRKANLFERRLKRLRNGGTYR